jgi:hypothetical protein
MPGNIIIQLVISLNDHIYLAFFPNSTTQPIVCANGGNITADIHHCQCPNYYSGDNCETIICINDGIVNPYPGDGQPDCICTNGYSGKHCELCKNEFIIIIK